MSLGNIEKNTIRHMAIVGGELHGPQTLGENDMTFRYSAMHFLEKFGVVMGPGFAPYLEHGYGKISENTEIVNIDERWGGKDFLKVDTRTDLLMFSNVSYRLSGGGDFFEGVSFDDVPLSQRFILESNRVSDLNHDDALWRKKVDESNAKIVVVVGSCDNPPENLAGDKYIILREVMGAFQGVLMRRDYLAEMKAHFAEVKSPLLSVAKIASSLTDIVEFRARRDFNYNLRFDPVFPDIDANIQPVAVPATASRRAGAALKF